MTHIQSYSICQQHVTHELTKNTLSESLDIAQVYHRTTTHFYMINTNFLTYHCDIIIPWRVYCLGRGILLVAYETNRTLQKVKAYKYVYLSEQWQDIPGLLDKKACKLKSLEMRVFSGYIHILTKLFSIADRKSGCFSWEEPMYLCCGVVSTFLVLRHRYWA